MIQFCSGLPNPANGQVTLSGIIEGSTATYMCDVGYILDGDEIRTCVRNSATIPGDWSDSEPTCISELNM